MTHTQLHLTFDNAQDIFNQIDQHLSNPKAKVIIASYTRQWHITSKVHASWKEVSKHGYFAYANGKLYMRRGKKNWDQMTVTIGIFLVLA
jgi:hypothetical protein